jgi:hypothetical protein
LPDVPAREGDLNSTRSHASTMRAHAAHRAGGRVSEVGYQRLIRRAGLLFQPGSHAPEIHDTPVRAKVAGAGSRTRLPSPAEAAKRSAVPGPPGPSGPMPPRHRTSAMKTRP